MLTKTSIGTPEWEANSGLIDVYKLSENATGNTNNNNNNNPALLLKGQRQREENDPIKKELPISTSAFAVFSNISDGSIWRGCWPPTSTISIVSKFFLQRKTTKNFSQNLNCRSYWACWFKLSANEANYNHFTWFDINSSFRAHYSFSLVQPVLSKRRSLIF